MVNEPENQIDNLTLRRLQESTATPLKTTEERVAYLKGRSDKAREVIQDLYCNHGGNAHIFSKTLKSNMKIL